MTSRDRTSVDDKGLKKTGLSETLKVMVTALVVAMVLRTFLFQSFHIPSASMEPALQGGDYIITTKYSLGYGRYAAPFELPIKKGRIFERQPERGDIIVFKAEGNDIHFIKRLVGLPGDEIQMIGGFLHVNGKKLRTEKIADTTQPDIGRGLIRAQLFKEYFEDNPTPHTVKHLTQGNAADDTGVFSVPQGYYFYMGDNRDNSRDSRFPVNVGGVGYVPAVNLVGRAEFVLLSVDENFTLLKPWTWGNVRSDRFFKGLR